MDQNTLYVVMYLEMNLIAVILVALIRIKTNGLSKMVSQQNFVMAIDAQMAFFISDTWFVMIKCGFFPYSKTAVMAAKEVYFFATALMCYFWFIYFECIQQSPFVKSRKRVRIASVLVWVMLVLLIVNLFTGVLFYVDSDGTYHRGPLFVVQYILSYAYVFVTCIRALIGIFDKKKYANRKMLIMLALFPIAPAGAGVIAVHISRAAACLLGTVACNADTVSRLDRPNDIGRPADAPQQPQAADALLRAVEERYGR